MKVVDFGLVKSFGSEDPGLSSADSIVGTPHFLTPEAIKSSSSVDPAQRPQTALALVHELDDAGAPAWSDTEARAWWVRRHQQHVADAKPVNAPQRTPTLLEVDVRHRARVT